MSWSGTVRCRVCYESGHNKRTCPEWTERLRKGAQRELDHGEGLEGYWGRQYAKRTGEYVDGTSAKELKQGRRDAGQQRRCTYCGTQGHNRRSCPTLKTDTATYIASLHDYRRRIVADMGERGMSVGSLLLSERWGEKFLVLIDRVNWSGITHVMGNTEVFQGSNPANGKRHNCGYPEGEFNESSYHRVNVVGPVGAGTVIPPEDFYCEASAATMAKEWFKERQSSDYHDNLYKY